MGIPQLLSEKLDVLPCFPKEGGQRFFMDCLPLQPAQDLLEAGFDDPLVMLDPLRLLCQAQLPYQLIHPPAKLGVSLPVVDRRLGNPHLPGLLLMRKLPFRNE